MIQFNPWSNNSYLFITEASFFVLLALQISNSIYYCYSDSLFECNAYPDLDSAQCESSGLFEGQSLLSSDTIAVLCPWKLYQSIKVFVLMFCGLIIVNLTLYRLMKGIFIYFRVINLVLIGLAGLFAASGLVDLITLSMTSCGSEVFTEFSEDKSCYKFWFYINALMQIVTATCLLLASLRLKGTKKPSSSKPETQGSFGGSSHASIIGSDNSPGSFSSKML